MYHIKNTLQLKIYSLSNSQGQVTQLVLGSEELKTHLFRKTVSPFVFSGHIIIHHSSAAINTACVICLLCLLTVLVCRI